MASKIADTIKRQGGGTSIQGRFNEVELLFISEQLDQHGEYLADIFAESIEGKNLRDTDELLDNISFKQMMSGGRPMLVFSFPSHGRLIEINFHKKRERRSIFEAVNTDSILWNLKQAKKSRKKKKDTRWYTRNMYGSLNRLLGRLASDYSEAEVARLKQIIENKAGRSFSGITTYI